MFGKKEIRKKYRKVKFQKNRKKSSIRKTYDKKYKKKIYSFSNKNNKKNKTIRILIKIISILFLFLFLSIKNEIFPHINRYIRQNQNKIDKNIIDNNIIDINNNNITDEILFYINRDIKINENNVIEIDNKIDILYYKNNIDFSNYKTDIKAIAIYLPNFYDIKGNNKNYNYLSFLEKINPIYKGHHQPRLRNFDNYLNNYNLDNISTIKKQIELAKSHGIYGFAIYYYWSNGKIIYDKPLNIIYENNNIEFNYMLIWKNENILNENNEILFEQKYDENNYDKFILDIQKYLNDKRYIKIEGKPVIGIFNYNNIPKLNEMISIWRKKSKDLGIGDIYIISCLYREKASKINDLKLFDAVYKSPPYDVEENKIIYNDKNNYSFYYGLFYSNIFDEDKIENFPIYRGSVLESDNSVINKKPRIYGEYNPEYFYLMNQILIKWIKDNYNEDNRFLFINAWNNYYEGTYLEPDEKFGYGSINALSKALFNLPYKTKKNNLEKLKKECLVAIHAHIFYEDLTNEIIDKINNIPVKFDLFITTTSPEKLESIQNFLKDKTKANNITTRVVYDTKEDVFPFLIQMKNFIFKYKYFCHIHSKKTKPSKYGNHWRRYLYANLLGDEELISEILSDFESYEKLGLIFPQNFYIWVPLTIDGGSKNEEYQNKLLGILYPGKNYNATRKYYDFPAGTMFWARTEAMSQIFQRDKINEILKDNYYPWVFERTLCYFVKINGFYYKKIFKYKY